VVPAQVPDKTWSMMRSRQKSPGTVPATTAESRTAVAVPGKAEKVDDGTDWVFCAPRLANSYS